MNELSGIIVCSPPPAGSSNKRIVRVSEETEVTSYSWLSDSTFASVVSARGISSATVIGLSSINAVWEVTVAILTTSPPSEMPAPITRCPTAAVPEFPSTVKFLVAVVIAPLTTAVTELFVWNEIISPTAITALDASWSSTVIYKSATAPAPFTKLSVPSGCVNARLPGQISTPSELPCVPAVLAAHSP